MRQVIQQMIPIRNMRFESDIVGKPKFLGKGFIGKAAAKFSDWAGKRGSLQVERPVEYEDIAYETFSFDTEEALLNLISKSKSSLNWILRQEIDLVITGPKDFYDVVTAARRLDSFAFQANLPVMQRDQYVLWGMKVIVVPWMDGILLLSSEMVKG